MNGKNLSVTILIIPELSLRSSLRSDAKSSVPLPSGCPPCTPTPAPTRTLLAVWLKSHADGSRHTRRAYERTGSRFLEALAAAGTDLRRATVDDVQTALEAMRIKGDGSASSAATVNTYVAAVKALLSFAHQVGFTRSNAAPMIKLRKVPRLIAQGLLSDVDTQLLIRAARPGRDRLMLEVGYFGALRVSELASLTWSQVIPRDTGEAQLAIVGKGDKASQHPDPR